MTTTTELKKLLFSMILKTSIWLVHLAANQSSVNEHTYILYSFIDVTKHVLQLNPHCLIRFLSHFDKIISDFCI